MNLEEAKVYESYSQNDKILQAFNYFNENITDEDLKSNLDFFNILDNVLFVGIDLGFEEDEQQIFDTINSLGIRLTTAELFKKLFFQ